ncbi:MAG: NTP transferase domain-containing protein, partial [Cyanobacteria bacterium J06560_2]
LHGFAQGWLAISSDWCLLLACDLPHLRADVLQQWWRRIQDCTVDGWLEPEMVPMASLAPGRRGWEPLCGFYHRRCLPSLNQRVETHQHSFQSWLKTFPIAGYNGVPSKMLFNCNTPADWKAANSQ